MDDLKVFVLYLNVDNKTQHNIHEMLYEYNKYLDKCYSDYPNVKFHVIPVEKQETKIECIYPPTHNDKSESDIVKIYQLLLQDKNGEAVEKMKILERKLKINKIINKDEH